MNKTYSFEGVTMLNPVTFKSNQTVFTNETLTLDISRLILPAQRWELDFRLMTNGNEDQLFTKLTSGKYTSGTMTMPQLPSALKDATFTGTATAGTKSAGANTVTITPTGSGVLPRGSFIQFGSAKKVYSVKSDVTFANGVAKSVSIFPNLVQSLSSGTTVKFWDDVQLTYLLADTVVNGITFSGGNIADLGTISVWEVRK